MQNPNEDTEWNDVLRAKGILPPKPKEAEVTEEDLIAKNLGLEQLVAGSCMAATSTKNLIVSQMTIPLVQGMLKYAFKADPTNPSGSCTDPAPSGCAPPFRLRPAAGTPPACTAMAATMPPPASG